MINLKEYADSKAIAALLAECMYPDEQRVIAEYEKYRNDPSRRLLGKVLKQQLVGLIGVIHFAQDEVELKHIAIHPDYRGQGLGRELIMDYMEQHHIKTMVAETDKDAVYFYKRLGFNITSLGEKYPGVERFNCLIDKG
jgi:ribosomal protein S18 acetylase RimI-like enzyme